MDLPRPRHSLVDDESSVAPNRQGHDQADDPEAPDEAPLPLPTLQDLDAVFGGAPEPRVTIDGHEMTLREAVQSDLKDRSADHYATRIDVRHLSYEAEVDESAPVASIGSLFTPHKKQMVTRHILQNINFSLLPYEGTALLGAPRSGKTSLFDIIAQRRKGEGITGHVFVNGHPPNMQYHHILSYVQQGDEHAGLLSVEETFKFAAWCQMPTDDEEVINARVRGVIELLQLQRCKDTIVGDLMHRGVSGGEKRRTSIGIEWLKGPCVMLLDEPTTGLDSGAAMNVVRILRVISKRGSPVLCSLLQPSWDMLQMFEKLIILSHGQIAYWGPLNEALPYFRSLGFECPRAYSAAEFLSEVVDHPEKFPPDPEQGPRQISTPQQFIEAWNKSALCARMLGNLPPLSPSLSRPLLHRPSKPALSTGQSQKKLANGQPAELGGVGVPFSQIPLDPSRSKKQLKHTASLKQTSALSGSAASLHIDLREDVLQDKYCRNGWEQFKLLFWRSTLTQKRDHRQHVINFISILVAAVVMALIFWRRDNSQAGIAAKAGCLFFVVARAAFISLAGVVTVFIERPFFYRQRAAKYYSVFPYVLNNLLAPQPVMFIDILVFTLIVYFAIGFALSAGQFLFFLLVAFTLCVVFTAFARLCAAIMPSPLWAGLLVTTMTVLLMLFNGFLISRERMPKPWIFMYYLSPLKYAIESVYESQFLSVKVFCEPNEFIPPPTIANYSAPYPYGWANSSVCPITSGSQFLAASGIGTSTAWMWGNYLILWAFLLLYVFLFYLAVRYIQFTNYWINMGSLRVDLSTANTGLEKRSRMSRSAVLSWENLNYTVPTPAGDKQLLKNINGYVQPYMLLALMGASGAGKTTLQDVLALRKNLGKTTGKMFVNGRPLDQSYNRIIGYVEQFDMHFAFQTVYEAVKFAADTRLPEFLNAEERDAVVRRSLELVQLEPIAGQLVGFPGVPGSINGEERKRLSMAVELASEPSILFLDEPTSGLDSDGADRVMAAVEKVARSGTAVICTIHQPSTRIFSRATHLLLLQRGGEQVFFGELGQSFDRLLSYFNSAGLRCPAGMNPADFVLEITTGNASGYQQRQTHLVPSSGTTAASASELNNSSVSTSTPTTVSASVPAAAAAAAAPSSSPPVVVTESIDHQLPKSASGQPQHTATAVAAAAAPINLPEIWSNSAWCVQMKNEMDALKSMEPPAEDPELTRALHKAYAVGWWRQFSLCSVRWAIAIWRAPADFVIMMGRAILLGLILGTVFWQRPRDDRGAIERVGMLFFSAVFSFLTAFAYMPAIYMQRNVYYRERAERMYRASPYALSRALFDLPVLTVALIVFSTVFYWMAGLARTPGQFFFFMLMQLMFGYMCLSFTQMLAALCEAPDTAGLLYASTLSTFAIAAGFLEPYPFMKVWVRWLYWMSFNHYNIEALAVNEFSGMKLYCENGGSPVNITLTNGTTITQNYCQYTTGEQFLQHYGFRHSLKWVDLGAIAGFWLLFLIVFTVALKFLVHMKR